MWIFNVVLVLFVVGLPLLGIWIWRMGNNLKRMRLESQQLQVRRFFTQMGPIWLAMVLLLGHQLLDLYPGSRVHRAFWSGFIIALNSFVLAFMIYNLVSHLRQAKDKRQEQTQAKVKGLDNRPDAELSRVRALLVAGLKIRAVQLYRQQTGESLESSMVAIEQMESQTKFVGMA